MGDSGLKASRWASSNTNTSNYFTGWVCPSCDFSNYQWRLKCFRCSTPGGMGENRTLKINPLNSNPVLIAPLAPNPLQPIPPATGRLESTRPPSVPVPVPVKIQSTQKQNGLGVEKGLATSRWAPRNCNANGTMHGQPQIWTRTIRIPAPSATSINPTSNPITTPSEPDLDLPYQVQHYILSLVQRILEEGCFDFASRWIPQVMRQKGWDCPEATELSTWRSFLPGVIPDNSLKFGTKSRLEAALADAVRIRNAAVHRHLCDNTEITRMISQARELMAMFSDTSRQEKLQHLSEDIRVWNATSKDDPYGARAKLEEALKAISERPLDDMDWTPNSVSLWEIPDLPTPDEVSDEMDLDI